MVHKETEHNIWGTLSNRELELLACRIRRRSRRTCGEVKDVPGFLASGVVPFPAWKP
jgi:hypothetical protein